MVRRLPIDELRNLTFARVPPNLRFLIDDAENMVFKGRTMPGFDFIHLRMTATCFGDSLRVVQHSFDSLVPGGYLETQDMGFPKSDIDLTGTAVEHWRQSLMSAAHDLGQDWEDLDKYKKHMKNVGFKDVQCRPDSWPVGDWEPEKRELGRMCRSNLLMGVEAISLACLFRSRKMSRDEIQIYLIDVRKDLKNPDLRLYVPVYVYHESQAQNYTDTRYSMTVFGRKPI